MQIVLKCLRKRATRSLLTLVRHVPSHQQRCRDGSAAPTAPSCAKPSSCANLRQNANFECSREILRHVHVQWQPRSYLLALESKPKQSVSASVCIYCGCVWWHIVTCLQENENCFVLYIELWMFYISAMRLVYYADQLKMIWTLWGSRKRKPHSQLNVSVCKAVSLCLLELTGEPYW